MKYVKISLALAFGTLLVTVFLTCGLFNLAYLDHLQCKYTLRELVAYFPLWVGPERTVQAGIEK